MNRYLFSFVWKLFELSQNRLCALLISQAGCSYPNIDLLYLSSSYASKVLIEIWLSVFVYQIDLWNLRSRINWSILTSCRPYITWYQEWKFFGDCFRINLTLWSEQFSYRFQTAVGVFTCLGQAWGVVGQKWPQKHPVELLEPPRKQWFLLLMIRSGH